MNRFLKSKNIKKGDDMKNTILILLSLAVLATLLVGCQTTQTQTPGYPSAGYAGYQQLTCCVYASGVKVGPAQAEVDNCYMSGGELIACKAPIIR